MDDDRFKSRRFGEKLMRLRRQRGWSLAVLAERLGYKSRGYLSQVEPATRDLAWGSSSGWLTCSE